MVKTVKKQVKKVAAKKPVAKKPVAKKAPAKKNVCKCTPKNTCKPTKVTIKVATPEPKKKSFWTKVKEFFGF